MTVSLPASLLDETERLAKRLGCRTRSALVERALRLLVRQAREAALDASLDAYYGARSASERSDERAMVRAFNRSQRRRDLDQEGR